MLKQTITYTDYNGAECTEDFYFNLSKAEELYMDKNKIPKPGEEFVYNKMKFIALGEEQGGILAIMAHELNNEMAYNAINCKNDWRKSTLRKYLNSEFLKKFKRKDLLPFVSDLTSDDGMKNYGTSKDFIALLSCDLYRKYREFIPKYNTWVWTITPWSCHPGYVSSVRLVTLDGSLNNYYAGNAHGVVPVCIFNRSIFE